ncbi:MAG: peptidoglycan DD-metalloendopeptidase family protein, partial [Ginsengibacter sp.]
MKMLFYFLMSATAAALWLPISISKVNITPVELHGIYSSTATPSIELVQVWPVDNSGNIVYLTSGPKSSAGSISALLSAKFKITNKENKTLTLNKIEYGCSGNGNNKKFSFTPNKDNASENIAASKPFSWQNSRDYHKPGDVIELSFPFPNQLTIKLYFDGFTTPFTITKSLKPYINEAVYSFPGKQKDLGYGEYWFADASHGGGSQVFSYDITIKAWDEKSKTWNNKYTGKDGSKNEDFRCFGRPVYAVADGEVVHFNDKIKDNVPGVDTDGGGNTFHIKVGNTVIRYYHLKQFSLNKNFMKIGAKVKRGDLLAHVGSTGTAGTHLHIDCVPADDTEPPVVFPLQFSDAYIIAQNNLNEPDPNAKWVKLNKTGLPYVDKGGCFIWPGDKPTWYPGGWGEIGRHGIPEKDYQEEFNKIWSSGYYPVWVDGYDVNGKTYFNAIFRYNDKGYKIA